MTHVTAKGSWDGARIRFADRASFDAHVRRMKLGEGEAVVIRVEREADAKRYHQLKWYFGYIVKQCSEHTGYPVPELDVMFRALFLPPDVETLSLMPYEHMRDFLLQCEHYAAETIGVVVTGPADARAA